MSKTTGSITNTARYWYGASRERIAFHDTADSTFTHYVGDLYELEASLSSGEAKVLERWHVHAPSGRVLTRVVTSSPHAAGNSVKLRYLHQDALGSVYAVTDNAGAAVVKYSYDAWGQQTRVTGSALEDDLSTRGYTDHEMLTDYGLIHMNGRLYDPTVSRFLSADPFVDDAKDAQSYNRYSYVNNNPLKYSDPSGYFKLSDALKIVVAVVVACYTGYWAAGQFGMSSTAGGIASSGAMTSTGAISGASIGTITTANSALAATMSGAGLSAGVINGIIGGAAGGFAGSFTGSLLNGGSLGEAFRSGLKGGIEGAITGGMLGAVGGMKMNRFARGLAHGAIHGGMAQASGGQFRHGFLSGFVSGSTDGWVDAKVTDNAAKVAVAALLAGTASSLGGGKFANGAVSGAFSMMFNELSRKTIDGEVDNDLPPGEGVAVIGTSNDLASGGVAGNAQMLRHIEQDKKSGMVKHVIIAVDAEDANMRLQSLRDEGVVISQIRVYGHGNSKQGQLFRNKTLTVDWIEKWSEHIVDGGNMRFFGCNVWSSQGVQYSYFDAMKGRITVTAHSSTTRYRNWIFTQSTSYSGVHTIIPVDQE